MLLVRFAMMCVLAWGMVCFAMYGWTRQRHWRTRGLRVVLGTLGVVVAFATVIWLQTL